MTNIKHDRLNLLYYRKECTNVRPQEAEALFQVCLNLMGGKLDYQLISIRGKVLFDRANFRQYINALQEAFSGLARESIADLANMKRIRLNALLSDKRCQYIRPEEITALCQVYHDLDSREKTYKRGRCYPRNPEGVLLDKPRLRRYIDSLKRKYSGLTHRAIAELADMTINRLNNLLSSPEHKNIQPQEIEALRKAGEDLESGKVTYVPDQRGRYGKKKVA